MSTHSKRFVARNGPRSSSHHGVESGGGKIIRGSRAPAVILTVVVLLVAIQWMNSNGMNQWATMGGPKGSILEMPSQMMSFGAPENNPYDSLLPPMKSSQCTSEQLKTISHQLPPDDCITNKDRPWNSKCSFSRASSCPNHVWLEDVHSTAESEGDGFVSYFVGCNKAIDAVETLHLGSKHNPKYDVNAWKQALVDSVPSQAGKRAFAKSSCAQFERPDKRNITSSNDFRSANVYCFEPITSTFQALEKAKMTLGWHNELILEQAAVGMEKGILFVPSNVQIGEEQQGMDNHQANCAEAAQDGSTASGCLQVPVYTLNEYVTSLPQQSQNKQIIHFLSIDVEGFDFQVLQGATQILKEQVQYLEFEYNWKGPWGTSNLKDAIDLLDNHGFTCSTGLAPKENCGKSQGAGWIIIPHGTGAM